MFEDNQEDLQLFKTRTKGQDVKHTTNDVRRFVPAKEVLLERMGAVREAYRHKTDMMNVRLYTDDTEKLWESTLELVSMNRLSGKMLAVWMDGKLAIGMHEGSCPAHVLAF
jgi:hypothetical protein